MPVFQIKGFSGLVPMTGDRAIPDAYAVESVNTWLYGQELRGVRSPVHLTNILGGTKKVLRVPKRTVDTTPPSFLGDSQWKEFQDHNTDILKGQLIEDKFERYYFCSPSTGPMFNTYNRMKTALPDYHLGVPGPSQDYDGSGNNAYKPIVGTPTGGTAAANTTCAYVYTWINEFGEESSPSLPGINSGKADAIWPITGIDDPPANPPVPPAGSTHTYPLYTKKRLYRTLAGGENNFYMVSEIALGTTIFNDNHATITDVVITNNLILESIYWALPPLTLQGWIAMPNGFLIGFDKPVPDPNSNKIGGNTVYMSEPYHWHAWPPQYKYATETPIVGLGVIGQTCVVCTQGYPTSISGTRPGSCSFVKVTTGEPCLSRGSVVSTPTGVIYASQNGLISIGPGGMLNVTQSVITRDEWKTQYKPELIRAVRYQNGYLALIGNDPAVGNQGFYLDPTALRVALTTMSDFDAIDALVPDFWSGEVFMLTGLEVMHWDAPPATPTTNNYMPLRWKSKEFQFPYQENFGAYSIYWDESRYSTETWGSSVLPVGERVRFCVWADRKLVYDQPVARNGRAIRLPSGFKADIWQFEIRSRAPVYSLQVASTVKELKAA